MKLSYCLCALVLVGCPDPPPPQSPEDPIPGDPIMPIDSPPTEPGGPAGEPLPKENDASGSSSPLPDH